MKIQFITSVAGARFAFDHDEVVDLPVDQAKGFIRARQAVPYEEPVVSAPEKAVAAGDIETGTRVAVETAAGHARKPRRNGKGVLGLFQRQ